MPKLCDPCVERLTAAELLTDELLVVPNPEGQVRLQLQEKI